MSNVAIGSDRTEQDPMNSQSEALRKHPISSAQMQDLDLIIRQHQTNLGDTSSKDHRNMKSEYNI